MPRLACLAMFAAVCLLSAKATAATRVEIVIDEPMADRSVIWPITTGVPFPRGGLTANKHCRLIDDRDNYHNVWWKGYGSQPYRFPANGKWLKEFISQPPPGAAWALDELRVSTSARYANFDVIFGGQQTYNPFTFSPSQKPFSSDIDTTLLFHFDGDLKDAAHKTSLPIQAELPPAP